MTDLRKARAEHGSTSLRLAAEMALKFCEDIGEISGPYPYVNGTGIVGDSRKVSQALRQALAQPEQEPFEYWNAVEGWVKIDEVREHFDSVGCGTIYKSAGEGRSPLYTAPPKREWVGLTDEDIYDYADKFLYQHGSNYGIRSFGKAIEAKLKEKNT